MGNKMKSYKTRRTARRLDRFKKAEHWSQRRVEEGFACDAAAFSANVRAIKAARWNDLKRRVENMEVKILEGSLDCLKRMNAESVEYMKQLPGWNSEQDPLQDIIDAHHAAMKKDPILSRAVIFGPNEYKEFADMITGGPGNNLDKIGGLTCINRLKWIERPEIEPWKFRYNPTYIEDENLANFWHLLWNYEETDAGLRERIKQCHGVK
jgi:hypothetical protein